MAYMFMSLQNSSPLGWYLEMEFGGDNEVMRVEPSQWD